MFTTSYDPEADALSLWLARPGTVAARTEEVEPAVTLDFDETGALPQDDDDSLYRVAREVQQDERLMAEMADWHGTVGDGLMGRPARAER